MKVHPAAELFPMMSEEELAELAEDIKQHGLRMPIVKDSTGQLIDGRNRLAACKLAGIDPTYEVLNGDPVAYIISTNVKRRHMSKGQQAMAVAMAYPDPEKGGRGKVRQNGPETLQFSKQRLSQARAILHHRRTLAEDVIRGTARLDDALNIMRQEQEQGESIEQIEKRRRKKAEAV